ncbi:MAG TPA: c-type cytochrome [Actinomycetota bacterium]|nr:c-type cytochrome [Actinomycetota bacterium]
MSGVLALSTVTTIALVAGILVGLAFVGGFVAVAMRRRPPTGPDIPPGMKPGPADEVLERPHLERVMGWGVAFTLVFAVAVAVVFLNEPAQNRADAVDLIEKSVHRGELWFQVTTEENPTGFGCEQCHGSEGRGGQQIRFTPPDGPGVFVEPPPLNNVCTRLTIEGPGQIRETIMQGREGTAMPSWSVRFAGAMNDQQIQDLINYIVELNIRNPDVSSEENLCLNPPVEGEAEEEPTPTGEDGTPAGDEATPAGDEATPAGEASPEGS